MPVVAVSTLDKLRHVPLERVADLGLAIVILIVAVFLIKKAARMNKIILLIIGSAILVILTMTWVYQRNEPACLSPFIDTICHYFPSAPPPLNARPEAGEPPGGKRKKPATKPEPGKPSASSSKNEPATTISSKVY